jgi:predicted outer membrane repeat protein
MFLNNTALYGGGVYTFGSSIPTYENCSFVDNVASNGGGGVRTTTSSLGLFKRCTFINNSAGSGGGVSSFSLNSTAIDECYFYNNYAQVSTRNLFEIRRWLDFV